MINRTADRIFETLLKRIVESDLRPGDPLAEQAIAEEFGLSRTPVREALHRLSMAGLVARGTRRAFVVRRMDQAELEDLFEALGEMEALVARLAALRMTAIERQELRDTVIASEIPGADYEAANARFHDILRKGAHNAILSDVLEDLHQRTMPWRSAQFRMRADRIRSSQTEHRAILTAVLAQDSEGARRQMREHMAASLRIVTEIAQTA